MPVPSPALEVVDLHKHYRDRSVLNGVSLHAPRGAITAVLGPNGAGKTTMIECCEGLRRPDGGTITVLGRDRSDAREAAWLRSQVGVMLQDGGLPQAPGAGEVLRHVARLHERREAVPVWLRHLGLERHARTRVRRLSGGQRQRLALACALVGEPELAFLDEPSAGLDAAARLTVWELLRERRRAGTSLVLTTHLMAEAQELADHIVIIDVGRVLRSGSPGEVRGPLKVHIGPDLTAENAAQLRSRLTSPGWRMTATHSALVLAAVTDTDLDTAALSHVASVLGELGLPGVGVSLQRDSLEEVFLSLTGRRLNEEAA